MNKNLFLRYVESARDCDQALLSDAVRKGLRRAKADRPDLKKLMGLAAACAATIALCITVNTSPFKAAADGYYRERSLITQNSAEALDFYARDIANTVIKYLGDG